MHPDLERIAQVAALDAKHDRAAKALEDAKTSVARAKTTVATATSARAAAQAELDAAKSREYAASRDVTTYRERERGAIRALETGAGNPEAAERQIAACRQHIDAAETLELESMEQQDGLKRQLVAATTALTEAEAALTATTASAPTTIASSEAEIRAIAAERAPIWAQLPLDLRSRYDTIRPKKRSCVAWIRDATCSACQLHVPAQQISDIARGANLEGCRGCGRWLIPG